MGSELSQIERFKIDILSGEDTVSDEEILRRLSNLINIGIIIKVEQLGVLETVENYRPHLLKQVQEKISSASCPPAPPPQ
jgi:hypothetical protein